VFCPAVSPLCPPYYPAVSGGVLALSALLSGRVRRCPRLVRPTIRPCPAVSSLCPPSS